MGLSLYEHTPGYGGVWLVSRLDKLMDPNDSTQKYINFERFVVNPLSFFIEKYFFFTFVIPCFGY